MLLWAGKLGTKFPILSTHLSQSEAIVVCNFSMFFTSYSSSSEARLHFEAKFALLASLIAGFWRVCFHGILSVIFGSTSVCPTPGKSFTFGSIPQLLRGSLYGSLPVKYKVIVNVFKNFCIGLAIVKLACTGKMSTVNHSLLVWTIVTISPDFYTVYIMHTFSNSNCWHISAHLRRNSLRVTQLMYSGKSFCSYI